MSALIATAVRHVWPDNRAKNIARALNVSIMTGKRISAGHTVSERIRSRLIALLDREIERNEEILRQLREELRLIEYAEARDRAGAAAAPMVGAASEGPQKDADR